MALYKLYPKVPYFSWAIMSLYVKSMVDPPETAERITLPLAEKMFAKFIIENQIKTEHELTLYLLILMKQVFIQPIIIIIIIYRVVKLILLFLFRKNSRLRLM